LRHSLFRRKQYPGAAKEELPARDQSQLFNQLVEDLSVISVAKRESHGEDIKKVVMNDDLTFACFAAFI